MNRLTLKISAVALGIIASFATALSAQELRLGPGTVVTFAGIERAREIITNRDEFLAAQSLFDRSARMQVDRDVSPDEFYAFLAQNVVAWTPDDTNRLVPLLEGIRQKLGPWHLPFPSDIQLVKTTGKEEFDSYYTRQSAILIPGSLVSRTRADVLIHELFHILSRQNPELRARLYQSLGFTRINDVAAPSDLEQRKITNPDGIQNGWRITVTNAGQALEAVPTIYIPAGVLPSRFGNPIPYFRLMEVENTGGTWSPKLVDGQPHLLTAANAAGYREQIGGNTGYIIHPDEILADNFVLLVNGATNAPTPRILDEMRRILARDGH